MQTLIPGADASRPGNQLPPGTMILGGYVGAPELLGQPDTPYLWTGQNWNWYLDPESDRPDLYGGPQLRSLPIYTHDYGGNPDLDARNAVDAMTDLGWHPSWLRVLGWDSEFLIDKAYEDGLAAAVWKLAGWSLMPYGVDRTITQVPAPDHSPGLWTAIVPTPKPRWLPPGTAGRQYLFGDQWDSDVFTVEVYNQCGRGPRRNVA